MMVLKGNSAQPRRKTLTKLLVVVAIHAGYVDEVPNVSHVTGKPLVEGKVERYRRPRGWMRTMKRKTRTRGRWRRGDYVKSIRRGGQRGQDGLERVFWTSWVTLVFCGVFYTSDGHDFSARIRLWAVLSSAKSCN